jgi:hypothetical protein
MTFENIISVISLLGIGGLLGAYFRILWERNNAILLQKQDFKEVRYKCIIILALAYLDFDKNKFLLQQNNREYIKKPEDLLNELKVEWNNMILFASEEALREFDSFIKKPSYGAYKKVAAALRKDLWGGKLKSDFIEDLG